MWSKFELVGLTNQGENRRSRELRCDNGHKQMSSKDVGHQKFSLIFSKISIPCTAIQVTNWASNKLCHREMYRMNQG